MMSLTTIRSRKLIPGLGGACLGGIYTFISQTSVFAVTDDYRLIRFARVLRPFILEGHARAEAETGRVLPGLLFKIIWFGVDDISDLWTVRLIGIVLVGISVVVFLSWLATSLKTIPPRTQVLFFTVGFLAMVLPGVSATTTWATKTTHLMAIPLAMFAGVLATRLYMGTWRWTTVTLLILLSVFSYQHFALLPTLPVALSAVLGGSISDRGRQLKRVGLVIAIGLFALICNVIFVRVINPGQLDRITGRPLSNRLAELIDVAGKGAHLFVSKSVFALMITLLLIAATVIVSIWVDSKSWKVLIGIVAASGCSVLITFGADGDSSYRMILPTQLTIWLGLGALAIKSSVKSRTPLDGRWTLLTTVLITTALLTAVDARRVVGEDITGRNQNDWIRTNCYIDKALSQESPREIVARLIPVELTGPHAVHSEVGLLASHLEWLFLDQWNLAITTSPERSLLLEVPLRVIGASEELPPQRANSYVIDLRLPCNAESD